MSGQFMTSFDDKGLACWCNEKHVISCGVESAKLVDDIFERGT